MNTHQSNEGGGLIEAGARRSLLPAVLIAMAALLAGLAVTAWLWRERVEGEREAFERNFHATAQEVISRMDTDVGSALTIARAMAASIRLLPALSADDWRSLQKDVQVDRIEPPIAALMLVDLASPEAADMRLRFDYLTNPSSGAFSASDPWLLRLAQGASARALLANDAAVATGGDTRPGGASLAVLAVPVTRGSVLLMFIDAQRWLNARGAILTQDAAVRAVEIVGAGHDRLIAETSHYPREADTTEVGVFTLGEQRWAFEVAALSEPPGYLARLGLLVPGLVASLALAAVLFSLAARKGLADRVVARVRRDLADTERRFERAVAASEDGIWEYQRASGRWLLSPQACAMLGLAPRREGFGLAALIARVLREDRAALVRALREAAASRGALDVECRVQAQDGGIRWIRVRGQASAPERGNEGSVIGALSDVSLHRRLAERLSDQQAFLSRVLDVVPVPIAVKARDGGIQLVNKAFERALGLARSLTIGRTTAEVATPQIASQMAALEAMLRRPGDSVEARMWLDLPAGHRHLRVARTLCEGADGRDMVVASYVDITDETHAEAREVAFRNYLQGLINAMPHAFFVKDANSRFIMVNPAFCRMYEQDGAEVIGKTPFEVYSDPALAASQFEDDQLVLAGGEIRGRELRFHTPAGTLRVTRVHKARCLDPEGNPLITGVVTDVSDLVAAQEGQREVIERLDALYRNAPFGLALVDETGRFLQANPAFCDMLETSEAALRERTLDSLSPPELRRDHRGRLAALLACGRLAPFETRFRGESRELAVRVAGAGLGHTRRGFQLAWTIVEDVSERVAAAAALTASEHRWQFALEGAGDGVWDWDLTRNRVYFSPRWKAMLGYAEPEIGDELLEWESRVHPDDLPVALAQIQQHLRGETRVYSSEHRMRCRDGSWKWILDRGQIIERDGEGRALRLIGTHTDITARKAAEDALRRSTAMLSAISAAQESFIRAPDAGRAFDGLLADVLHFADSEMGFIGEVVQREAGSVLRIHAVAHGEKNLDAQAFYRAHANDLLEFHNPDTLIGAVLRSGDTVIANDPPRDPRAGGLPPGHPPLTSFLGLPVRYGKHVVGVVGVANRPGGYRPEDCAALEPLLRTFGEIINARTTELARRAAEAELAQHRDRLAELVREQTADLVAAKESAEAANEAKSAFLANMSHELRTPLHAILSFARLGDSKVGRAAEDRLREYFQRIATSGERLLNLLNDLLDLAKLESGHMRIEISAVQLEALVRDTIAEYEAWFAAKHLQVDVRLASGALVAWADPVRFGQVLRNLLSNAVKFSPDGGSVRLALEPAMLHGPGGVEIDAVELSVRDDGIGIPESELETVFDKFVQSSKTHTGAGGTGLGLAISREIVAAHGGVIFARNNPDGGATFVVRLPAVRDLPKE
ncbi:PAS domain S-box protein [Niveibacterium sp.]|uniref:PAS domain S-box protein n=1 Tax=Niveibacterium sp. TaxID=2017444 RepID=UPI0035B2F2FB